MVTGPVCHNNLKLYARVPAYSPWEGVSYSAGGPMSDQPEIVVAREGWIRRDDLSSYVYNSRAFTYQTTQATP